MVGLLTGLWLGCGGEPAPDLQDPDPQARKAALYALGPDGVASKLGVLISLAGSDPEPTVRRLALGLLGTSQDPRGVPVLKAALHDWSDTSGQLTAATALGNVRHTDACVVLVDALIAWPTERDSLYDGLRSSLLLSDPVCNDQLHARKPERPDRVGDVLLTISRAR